MTSIRKELAEYGLTPKKGWGQHFLVDRNVLNNIIRTAQIDKKDVVLEIGPGFGEMTRAIARQAKRVIAFEIDPKLVEILKDKIKECQNVEVLKEDILKVDFKEFFQKEDQPVPDFNTLTLSFHRVETDLLHTHVHASERSS